jgi:hypothetical protein
MAKNYNFNQWVEYFISNKRNLKHVEWSDLYKLNEDEFAIIFDSIRIFQRGESSEAKHIFKKANEFLKGRTDQSYMEALTLFINEEHRHAFELKRFMSLQDIPCLKKHWTDSVFRQLRRLGKLEQSISVLLTAEIIAAVYYKALLISTKSKTLKQICEQILADEEMHIRFQAEAIRQFYSDRSPIINKIITLAKLFLLEGTICVVWKGHQKVMLAAGYDFFSFRKECLQQFRMSDEIIQNKLSGKIALTCKVVLQPVISKKKLK